MQHVDVWRGLDLLAEKHGLTASGLARRAGLDATAFNKSKRRSSDGRPRWPSTESISRALEAVGEELDVFADLVSGKQGHAIPVLSLAETGEEGRIQSTGHLVDADWELTYLPGPDFDAAVFAIEISGTDLDPVYRLGDRLIVSPTAGAQTGDRAVVKLASGAVLVGEIRRRTRRHLELSVLPYPSETRIFEASELTWIARILWVSQ